MNFYNQTRNKDRSTDTNEEDEVSSPKSQDDEPSSPHHTTQRPAPDFNVDIPDFEGSLDVDDFVEWLKIVERVLDYQQTPEHKKIKIVALKFKKYA